MFFVCSMQACLFPLCYREKDVEWISWMKLRTEALRS